MTDNFRLHPRLSQDSIYITQFDLCELRLINNCLVPWVLLVPKQNNLVDITDLSLAQNKIITEEIYSVSTVMKQIYHPEKLNIASLGNVVPQMHWHIIARFKNDACWPDPVWGNIETKLYDIDDAQAIIRNFTHHLS